MNISSTYSVLQPKNTSVSSTSSAVSPQKAGANEASPPSLEGSIKISGKSEQLLRSAELMDQRVKNSSRDELGMFAKGVQAKLTGAYWAANRAEHNAEASKSEDPELIERARQATRFNENVKTAANPFSSYPNDQLQSIVYDDSGAYTINERRAAFYESYSREEAWNVRVAAQAVDEYNKTGKLTGLFKSALDHFSSLSDIEKSVYPADYASELQNKIDSDFDYLAEMGVAKEGGPKSLLDALLIGPKTRSPSEGISPQGDA